MIGKYLVYYTHGYSNGYLDILKISIKSLRSSLNGKEVDIVILSDEQFVNDCNQIENVTVISMPNSKSPEEASMHKIHIFNSYNNINNYDAVLFIDSDIVVLYDVCDILEKCIKSNCLYVFTETKNIDDNNAIFWSFNNHTEEMMNYFREKEIYPFNAGFFAFKPDEDMRKHFNNIINNISTHTGAFFYEQSFMNAYFNTYPEIITDRTLITSENYIIHPNDNIKYINKCLHFCGCPGNASFKCSRINNYINRFGININ